MSRPSFSRPYAFAQYWGSHLFLFHPNERDHYKPGRPFAKLRYGLEATAHGLKKRRYLCCRYITVDGERYRVIWLYRENRGVALTWDQVQQLDRWLSGKEDSQ